MLLAAVVLEVVLAVAAEFIILVVIILQVVAAAAAVAELAAYTQGLLVLVRQHVALVELEAMGIWATVRTAALAAQVE